MEPRGAGSRCLLGIVAALVATGCNSILGIDAASLEADAGTVEAGSDASGEAGGEAGSEPGACGSLDKGPCGMCLAAKCCTQFEACQADPACKLALVRYNGCLGAPPGDAGTGVTCNEEFGTMGGAKAGDLADCAFGAGCFDSCIDKVIGDLCQSYCGCMRTVCCPDSTSCIVQEAPIADSLLGDCLSFCNGFTPSQLRCRSYHCNLASRTTPEIHCEHAVGQKNTCVE